MAASIRKMPSLGYSQALSPGSSVFCSRSARPASRSERVSSDGRAAEPPTPTQTWPPRSDMIARRSCSQSACAPR